MTTDRPRWSLQAIASLILGLLSVFGLLLILTGLPAVLLGWIALRHVNHSEGRLRGARLAVAGLILGAIGTVATAVGLVAVVLIHLQEGANRVTCQDNLRRIGLGLERYYEDHKRYPMATIPNDDLPPEKRLSWLAALLPYLEQPPPGTPPAPGAAKVKAAGEQLKTDLAWDAPANRPAVTMHLRVFVCPSSADNPGPGEPGLTTYVGLTGVGPDAAELPEGSPRAGFFGYHRVLTRDELQKGRGLSATLVAVETAHENGPWAAGGFPTVRGVEPSERPYIGPGRPFGGLHPGGVNVLFADGSVRFLNAKINAEHFERLALIHPE